jgi:hypothetical protein
MAVTVKCNRGTGTSRPKYCGLMSSPVNKLAKTMWVGFLRRLETNPNYNILPNPVNWWGIRTCRRHYLQWSTTAALEQIIFATAGYPLSAMKTIVEIIHLRLKCSHVEALYFSGLDPPWRFHHTTNYESERSSPHLWQRESET